MATTTAIRTTTIVNPTINPSSTLPSPPPLGHPVPNTSHAVSVQLPEWKDMCGFAVGETRVKEKLQCGYPRSFIHFKIRELATTCLCVFGSQDDTCLLFPALALASACVDFLTDSKRGPMISKPESVSIRSIAVFADSAGDKPKSLCLTKLYAVLFAPEAWNTALVFWRLSGTGISSRRAEYFLGRAHLLREKDVDDKAVLGSAPTSDTTSYDIVRVRIAQLLERSPLNPNRSARVAASDVFLFPTGMSAIYELHQFLLRWRGAQSVVFGFPYELTLKMVQDYGPGCTFFGFGTSKELDQLERFLVAERSAGRQVQAVWCECASNPLLRTVDLGRIRRLADEYEFVVVVDETIGSFANVDVLDVADIVMTSLTKSFSGYANVMAGSVVLNPTSPFHSTLKPLFSSLYRNDLFIDDVKQLELNSRDFLPRVARLNATASMLVDALSRFVTSPRSTITAVYYPKVCWSVANYQARMRPATLDFEPGYGGLFTIDFRSVVSASIFFNALNVHKGPSLGANITLAQPYVQTVFTREKEWAAGYGLAASIVRISVGLEEPEALWETFREAVKVTDGVALLDHSDVGKRKISEEWQGYNNDV